MLGSPDRGDSVSQSGERLEIGGTDNAATTPKVQALFVDTPAGRWRIETYDSGLGACLDLVAPDASRQPACLQGTGIGGPGPAREFINGPAWNFGLGSPGQGVVNGQVKFPTGGQVKFPALAGGG